MALPHYESVAASPATCDGPGSKKGLRDRNNPKCTLRQDGYGASLVAPLWFAMRVAISILLGTKALGFVGP